MSCDRERLSAWFDGALDEGASRDMEEHLEGCPRCRAWLDDLERLLEASEMDETAAPLTEEQVRRVLVRCPGAPAPGLGALWRSFWKTRVQIPLPALALAAALLVLFLGRSLPREGEALRLPSPQGQLRTASLQAKSSPTGDRLIPIHTIVYDPDRSPEEEETVAAPPLPPFLSRRPRGRWVVLEEHVERPPIATDGTY